jgi:cyclopropane fatty-acyl-phospholipid synthase-like methyltransferase
VLELASGNGSNSQAIAARSLRLDATEGMEEGTRLTARALAHQPRARAIELGLARFQRRNYDASVTAELLYFLSRRALASVTRDVAAALPSGGRLVLAHHRIDFLRLRSACGWHPAALPTPD